VKRDGDVFREIVVDHKSTPGIAIAEIAEIPGAARAASLWWFVQEMVM